MKQHTVCFSGYRPEKLDIPAEELVPRIEAAVRAAVDEGYTRFISGMARGFDMLAARAVLEYKRENDGVRLECALPFETQASKWRDDDLAEYEEILRGADSITVVCASSSPESYIKRNRYMVEHASRLICYFDGRSGGTAYTYKYARRQGLDVVNLGCFDEQLSFS